MKDKFHIISVFALVILFVIALIFATRILRPDSFDKHGHYRWNAVNEIIKNNNVINQNTRTCGKCHKAIYQLHEKDAHYSVPCVDCHGAGNLHVAFYNKGEDAKNITAEQAKLPKEYKLEGCLFCHRKLKARPSDFPQIDKNEHFKFLNVKDTSVKCIECHSPHEPIFLLTEARASKLHPIVYKCTDCHNTKPAGNFKDVKNHPTIFECRDCHSQIVTSFEQRPHNKYVECRTCHLFHKENESVGRMYKNGNAKFCLLCHKQAAFKDPKYPPKIDWPAHIANSKLFAGNADLLVKIDQKICLNCHTNQIHEMNPKGRSNPHLSNWRTLHKSYINKTIGLGNVKKVCNACHQESFCSSCHKMAIPHSDDFKGGAHKDFVKAKGRELCAKCHPKDQCKFCHD